MKKSFQCQSKKLLVFLCTIFIFLSSFSVPIQARAATTLNESTIRNYLNGKNGKTESNYGGLCLKWAFTQFKNMGAANAAVGRSSCCAHYAATVMNISTDPNIPIGALVFFSGPSNQGTCSSCHQHYGHVGIHVGDNVVSSIHGNGKIKNESISLWNSWGYSYMGWSIPKNVEINRDITRPIVTPSISDLRVSNVKWSGFDISCIVTNDQDLAKVEFPTWTAKNDQDDLIWHRASKGSDGRWHYHVSVSDHKNESGLYYVHGYAFAINGTSTVNTTSVVVPEKDSTGPTISDRKVENITSNGYDVSCKITDPSGIKKVQFITIASERGDGTTKTIVPVYKNGRYSAHIDVADFKNVRGGYITMAYAWDSMDNKSTSFIATLKVPDPTEEKKDENTDASKKKEAEKVETVKDKQVGEEIVNDGDKYVVSKSGEVSFSGALVAGKTNVVIPATIVEDGVEYKVTSIADNAFKGNKKLKKVTIGENIVSIGKNAFVGCKNLKKVTIKTTALTKNSVGKNAFKGINAKAKFYVPKKHLKDYKKILKARGANGKSQKISK